MEGFIDLRQNSNNNLVSDNFWPSFTDIMTVVVMIFLITSSVLIIHNWELIQELKNTKASEQTAEEIARFAFKKNATLEEQLINMQHQLSLLRMQLMRSQEEKQQLSQHLQSTQDMLSQQKNHYHELEKKLDYTKIDLENSIMERDQLSQQILTLQLAKEQLQKELLREKQANIQWEERNTKASQSIQQLQQEIFTFQQNIQKLNKKYQGLEVQYKKLIRPARSPKGKYVVEVRYEKIQKRKRIQIKYPEDKQYHAIHLEQLEKTLQKLQKDKKNHLYIKIIIPDRSGLSYNEAWSFTTKLLKYDYYHQ